ncbi:ABC transporter ATP-binding protein [Aquisalimonas sp.]|uniref:ABC transporter ATP-binding protein n=1 Tax=Aquisalimonas sp. TaxID=1872621 RepID=UPI0025C05DD7|nr:ABC transporter ATP-binding protein [Aquisalimonas sp.]
MTVAGAEPTLRVDGVHFRWPERQVLNGVDMDLAAGELYALLGPNGAGKTTLIKAICGRISPQSGQIRLDGVPMSAGAAGHSIGLVPQALAIYGHLTPRENLEVFARLAGVPRREIKPAVAQVLESTMLSPRADDLVRTLSGGYQRRVNIAAAIVHKPRLLILDEPTAGVDVDARGSIHQVLRGLRAAGMAVLLTTHDLEQAEVLCDRVGFLLHGRLAEQGSPDALLRQHFGDAREIVVVLKQSPDSGKAAWLRQQGLSPTRTSSTWAGLQSANNDSAERLSERLLGEGMEIRELRLRMPDLSSLFLKLTGQEAAA